MIIKNTSARVIHINTQKGNFMIVPSEQKEVPCDAKDKVIVDMIKEGLIENVVEKKSNPRGK